MVLISILTTVVYLAFIVSFVYGFDKVPLFKLEDLGAKTKFSVVIPFRNEAQNLPDLLKSISKLKYPKQLFEIIFVDDASEDNSVEIIKKEIHNVYANSSQNRQPIISILNNERSSNSPKKDAITTAINHSEYQWIITTDADCTLPKYWLNCFDACIQKTNSKCIVAPVTYYIKNDFLSRFQLIDSLSLQGATIGGFGINKPFLCNGANFAYKKELFKELNGFKGNSNIASGDDIFLLEKVVKTYPKHIQYLKCQQAVVSTSSQPSWRALIGQRIRWAAKTTAYTNGFAKLTGFVVLLMNTLVVLGLLLCILGYFNYKPLIYLLMIKISIDFLLTYKSASFFNQKEVLGSFFFAFVLYPSFSVYVALISIFTGYKWKGRFFKK